MKSTPSFLRFGRLSASKRKNRSSSSCTSSTGSSCVPQASQSSRTGGFEIQQDQSLVCDDDSLEDEEDLPRLREWFASNVSIADDSLYTTPDRSLSPAAAKTPSRQPSQKSRHRTTSNGSSAAPPPPASVALDSALEAKNDVQVQESVETTLSSNWKYCLPETTDTHHPVYRHFDEYCCCANTTTTLGESSKPEDTHTIHSDTSVSLSLQDLNMSDTQLMDDIRNPGALRLTQEGLKRHDRKTLGGGRNHTHVVDDDMAGFAHWKQREERRKYYRAKHKERDEALLDQALRMEASREIHLQEESRQRRRDEMDISLAPLNAMDHVWKKPKKKKLFGWKVPKAESLLQRERQKQVEYQTEQQLQLERERQRIQRRKQAALEEQRLLQATQVKPPDYKPCVVCLERPRTHIAVPCMHYQFCRDCALTRNACPACQAPCRFSLVQT